MEPEDDEAEAFHKSPPWPLWVSVGLWGLPGRGWAWGFFWFSLLAAVGCTAYGFISWPFFAGSGFALAAVWYYFAIRWVDQNSEWP
jgi:hypothetical protein